MRDQQPADTPAEKKPAGEVSVKELWAEAAKAFEEICGESLQRGDVKGFDDVHKKIEGASKASYGLDPEQDSKWEKAKSVGFASLKYLKMLVGAASQASAFIPIPSSAANIASAALCFVFDIPVAIKGYNDAVDQVFGEVSSALSQFQIYTSMDKVDPVLVRQLHLVMVSFVKLCAHVVKYRQGRKRDRFLRQVGSIFDEDSGLGDEMAVFKRALQQQRDIEGTFTLAMVVESRNDIADILERSIDSAKTTEATHLLVQETQKDMQSFKNDTDRSKTLINIRDTLNVPATVRLDGKTTQTCTIISKRCLNRTGSWIWELEAYTTWTAPTKDKETSHALIVSGPASSGKTLATALITKRLEEQKGRTYVAHYFFPASTKKNDEEKDPVHSALKYMAFQIARVDATTVQKQLGRACDVGPGAFRRSTTLDALWEELKIGMPGSNATYYLVFDGIENLPEKQTEILLKFVFGSKLAEDSAARVRVLVSGRDDQFSNRPMISSNALRIRMEEHNVPDMRIVVEEALTKQGMLEHAKPDSDQQRARNKIIEKLPQNVSGSYSRLEFGLDDVTRLLSTRTPIQELDRILDQPMSSHEAAIKNLQRSLTGDDISELNELLKWVLFGFESMTLEHLEAAMFLYSGTESLASLEFIIKRKYSAVLKLEDGYVYGQDGVKDYLQKDRETSGKSSHSGGRSTISMSITINNVDQELCGHFLWDLAHKAIRDKFRFDFDTASANGALHSNSQAAITVDEFEAHHTLLVRSFEYLNKEPREQTREIGKYIIYWLPCHLAKLRHLEDEGKGELTPSEQFDIGENLYKLLKDEQVYLRHRESFEQRWWSADEIGDVRKVLMDSAIMRRIDKKWRDEVQRPGPPSKGFMKVLVKMVVGEFLRNRSWPVLNAFDWIEEFIKADEKDEKAQHPPEVPQADEAETSVSTTNDEIDYDRVSAWCQDFLGLPNEALDSLWYERLALTSLELKSKAEVTLSLYQRAIEKENPSWLCHRGLGITHSNQGQTQEAMEHVELALKGANEENATPKPEAKDIVDLRLLLGHYLYGAGDMQKAGEHYLFACSSEDAAQEKQGQLGYLKTRLGFTDTEAPRQLLRDMLAKEGGNETIASILKSIARDINHEVLVPRMFTVVKRDADLLKDIVRAMETATTKSASNEERAADVAEEDQYAEDEARGVLLYDLGVAAYKYKVSLDGTEPIDEALRLWGESYKLLSNVGGRNAFMIRQDAITALAQHYFHSMLDGKHLNHVGALTKLAEGASSNLQHSSNDAVGFLGAVYALQGEKEQAKAALKGQMKQALQMLSDNMPENDQSAYSLLEGTLEQCQDFKNAATALSLLAQPDLVTDALYFDANDLAGIDDVDKEQLLDMVTKLAKEAIQAVKHKVPDISQQSQRIEAAKAYVENLMDTTRTKPQPDTSDDHGKIGEPEGEQEKSDPLSISAHGLLQSRLSKIDIEVLTWPRFCDGLTPDGKRCENKWDIGSQLYHCLYCCSGRDFCEDCLGRLRDPATVDGDVEITMCSAKHRWVKMPPFGVGPKAKSAWIPKDVRPMKDDENILEIYYDYDGDGGREEITVEAWKENLAKEWDISLEEIRLEISRQATPDGDGQDEKVSEE